MDIPNAITQLPSELAVLIVAATPIFELRGSIPLAIIGFKMPVPLAVFWSLLGNLVPLFLIYAVGNQWLRFVEARKGFWERLTDHLLRRTRRKFEGKYLKYGLWALALFVAVPLPVTGAWTGSLAAFIFGIPLRQAWRYVLLGLVVAAIIVSLATTGAIAGAGLLTK
jgi:uncharacterized membrane protein